MVPLDPLSELTVLVASSSESGIQSSGPRSVIVQLEVAVNDALAASATTQ